MAQNSIACDREQPFLLPPDVREWLPEDHLAWFVIDAVGVIDTTLFYAAYREDGHGRAAYEPAMMIALVLYCWARGTRSSRAIERACVEDVACRVIAAQQQPDHATIAASSSAINGRWPACSARCSACARTPGSLQSG
jgi:transposase